MSFRVSLCRHIDFRIQAHTVAKAISQLTLLIAQRTTRLIAIHAPIDLSIIYFHQASRMLRYTPSDRVKAQNIRVNPLLCLGLGEIAVERV